MARIYQELKKLTKEDSTVLQVQQTEDLMPDVKWYDKAVFYHIYPLGLCGCAHEITGVPEEHFDKLNEWAVHAGNI